jgi:Fungal Zn(2)-Cys(6) binuclear cluster domain
VALLCCSFPPPHYLSSVEIMSAQQRAESNACDQCFRRKQSCSKTQPECQRCLASGSSCTYSFGKFMGKPKKSLKNRRQFQNSTDGTSHEAIKATSEEGNLKCQMLIADDHPLPSPTLPDSRGGRITTSKSNHPQASSKY